MSAARPPGRRILAQLTEAFGRMMLGAGFIHADLHPGNIFLMEGARVALIDCGQVKQISTDFRLKLAQAVLSVDGSQRGRLSPGHVADMSRTCPQVDEWQQTGGSPELVQRAKESMAEFGVTFVDDAPDEAAAALALLLFGDPDAPMPGGFSNAELSPDSPIKAIASFPQELVLLGRATILIKGIVKRLGVRWSLVAKWKPAAEAALECAAPAPTPASLPLRLPPCRSPPHRDPAAVGAESTAAPCPSGPPLSSRRSHRLRAPRALLAARASPKWPPRSRPLGSSLARGRSAAQARPPATWSPSRSGRGRRRSLFESPRGWQGLGTQHDPIALPLGSDRASLVGVRARLYMELALFPHFSPDEISLSPHKRWIKKSCFPPCRTPCCEGFPRLRLPVTKTNNAPGDPCLRTRGRIVGGTWSKN